MTFSELNLSAPIISVLNKIGYTIPTPIQSKSIPYILQGKDIFGCAQTGTGKTAAFALPILQLLSENEKLRNTKGIKALILAPTRELASQISENITAYSAKLDIKHTVIFGGVSQHTQVNALRNGVDILIATPGRLLDLMQQGIVKLNMIHYLVLDEADRMLDMGFARDLNKLISFMPAKRQNLMFSATFSNDIKKLAAGILRDPVSVETAPQNATAQKVSHKVYQVDKGQKTPLMIKLIKDNDWSQVLVFTRTKHGANKLTEKLIKAGISAAAIHGNKSQGARTKALKNFKDNSIKILVATDIAARGLDIPLLPHVINFELPNVPEDYVHRIGRTGRAGAEGEAISFVCSEETEYQKEIEKVLNEKLKTSILDGFEPTDTAPAKRAASQSKGSFGKKKGNTNTQGDKPKRKPHFKGNTTAGSTSGRGRTGAPKKKRY